MADPEPPIELSEAQLKARVKMLEGLLVERNKEVHDLLIQRNVAQSEAKNAKALDRENLQLKRKLRESQNENAELTEEGRGLKRQLGLKEHKDQMARLSQMLDSDNYDEAGPVAAWNREQGISNQSAGSNRGAPVGVGEGGSGGTVGFIPTTTTTATDESSGSIFARGSTKPVQIQSSGISSLGFSKAMPPRPMVPPPPSGPPPAYDTVGNTGSPLGGINGTAMSSGETEEIADVVQRAKDEARLDKKAPSDSDYLDVQLERLRAELNDGESPEGDEVAGGEDDEAPVSAAEVNAVIQQATDDVELDELSLRFAKLRHTKRGGGA